MSKVCNVLCRFSAFNVDSSGLRKVLNFHQALHVFRLHIVQGATCSGRALCRVANSFSAHCALNFEIWTNNWLDNPAPALKKVTGGNIVVFDAKHFETPHADRIREMKEIPHLQICDLVAPLWS